MRFLNLWPWRDVLRKKQAHKQRVCLIGLSLVCVIVFSVWGMAIKGQCALIQEAIITQEHQLHQLPLPLLKKLYHQKKRLLNARKRRRETQAVHRLLIKRLATLSNVLPSAAYLTKLHSHQGVIELQGKSRDVKVVSHYVDALHQKDLAAHVVRLEREPQATVYRHHFVLSVEEVP
jgi:Tfp pilus assembly protein PilN